MDTLRKPKPSMREYLRKKAPFYFYNLFTALLITYLFLPTIVDKNYYQMFGHNQIISVSIDPTENSTYLSRLIVYKENLVDEVELGDRAVFYDEIAGILMPVDGTVTEISLGQDHFVVTSADHLTNQISDTNFLGTFVRESHMLDRYMYFNFKFHWRILTDINSIITVYVFYYVFFKKDAKPPLSEEPKKAKASSSKKIG